MWTQISFAVTWDLSVTFYADLVYWMLFFMQFARFVTVRQLSICLSSLLGMIRRIGLVCFH